MSERGHRDQRRTATTPTGVVHDRRSHQRRRSRARCARPGARSTSASRRPARDRPAPPSSSHGSGMPSTSARRAAGGHAAANSSGSPPTSSAEQRAARPAPAAAGRASASACRPRRARVCSSISRRSAGPAAARRARRALASAGSVTRHPLAAAAAASPARRLDAVRRAGPGGPADQRSRSSRVCRRLTGSSSSPSTHRAPAAVDAQLVDVRAGRPACAVDPDEARRRAQRSSSVGERDPDQVAAVGGVQPGVVALGLDVADLARLDEPGHPAELDGDRSRRSAAVGCGGGVGRAATPADRLGQPLRRAPA